MEEQDNIALRVMSEIITHMKYARFLNDIGRRETWTEIVMRNMQMHMDKFPKLVDEIGNAYSFVLNKEVLPSSRSLQFAGRAMEINPVRGFNCSYCAINNPKVFSEIMFLLLSGTGCGYSVQRHHVRSLPFLRIPIQPIDGRQRKKRYLVGDSIEGWADAIDTLVNLYFQGGKDVEFDYRGIRPKGSLLITSGGKAPGPQPLKDCIHNIRKIFDNALVERGQGTQLTTLEVHDIICFIADAVLAGGIRRASCIAFFSIDDELMLSSKFNHWWEQNPQRARANNSVVIVRHKVQKDDFFNLWDKIVKNGTGEPGVFFTNDKEVLANPCQPNWAKLLTPQGILELKDIDIGDCIWSSEGWTRVIGKWSTGIKEVYRYTTENGSIFEGTENHKILQHGEKVEVKIASEIDTFVGEKLNFSMESSKIIKKESISKEEVFSITVDNRSHTYWTQGCNVSNCGEISLSSENFCNLSTINAGSVKNQKDLDNRVRIASFIGTLQASYVNFHYLRDTWQENAEKEALIGVSMTGIANGNVSPLNIAEAAKIVIKENKRIAKLIGINEAYRTTTLKPEGTASLLLGTSSGIHAWYNDYYIRRIRVGKNEAIYHYLEKNHPELLENDYFKPQIQSIISIPIKAPQGAILRTESALSLLERIKKFSMEWIIPGHKKGSNHNNVSATISVKENEWEIVGNWMWENKEFYNGITVLPYDGGKYVQAPFEDCTKEEYEKRMKSITDIDVTQIKEIEDNTSLMENIACGGGSCEIK